MSPRSADPPAGEQVLAAPAAAVAFLGVLGGIQSCDPTIASTVLIEASRGLGMSPSLTALAASISTLMLAATVMSAGLLGDRAGRRAVLVGALLLAAAGDLISALAPGSAAYLIGRALAGAGLGAVYAAAFTYIRVITPAPKIAAAMGVFTAACAAALLVGSFAGGFLATVNWRLAFVLVPASCLISVPLALTLLPKAPRITDGGRDLLGQVLVGLGIVGVLYGIGNASSGLGSPRAWGPLAVGLLLLGLFVVAERRRGDAFFPVAIFRRPVFLAALCAGFIFNYGQAVVVIQTSSLWQYVEAYSPLRVAVAQLPFLVIGIIAALLTGRWISRGMTDRRALLIGSLITGAGFVSTLLYAGSGRYVLLLPMLLLVGFGSVAVSVPFGNLIFASAQGGFAKHLGPISSSRTAWGQFAYALGMAVSVIVVDRLTLGGTVRKLEAAGVSPSQTGDALDTVFAFAQFGTPAATDLGREALKDAGVSFVQAFTVALCVTGGVLVLVGLLGWWLAGRAAAVAVAAPEPAPAAELAPALAPVPVLEAESEAR